MISAESVSTRMNSMQAFGAAQGNFTNALKGAGAAIAAVGMAAAPINPNYSCSVA